MTSPVFNRLSDVSTQLVGAKDGPMETFTECAEKVAVVLEEFFRSEASVEITEEPPSLLGWVFQCFENCFSSPPTARSVHAIEVEAQPLYTEKTTVKAIVSEAQLVIVSKLLTYSSQGEGQRVSFNQEIRDGVLRYLSETINGIPRDIFSMCLNSLIKNLENMNENDNTVDWQKIQSIVLSLQRIGSSDTLSQ